MSPPLGHLSKLWPNRQLSRLMPRSTIQSHEGIEDKFNAGCNCIVVGLLLLFLCFWEWIWESDFERESRYYINLSK